MLKRTKKLVQFSVYIIFLSAILTGCNAITSQTIEAPQARDIRTLSEAALEEKPTSNITAQVKITPYSNTQVQVRIVITNTNSYPITITNIEDLHIEVYNSFGKLTEMIKNQTPELNQIYLNPGQSLTLETYILTKETPEEQLALAKLTFTSDIYPETKSQIITAVF